MPSICILTDNSVQFPQPVFPGQQHVKIIPMTVEINGQQYTEHEFKPSNLPKIAIESLKPKLLPPSEDDFIKLFSSLADNYDTIIAIFISSSLCACYNTAVAAFETLNGKLPVHLIDSQTFSVGQGLLVTAAAEAIVNDFSPVEIDREIRSLIPNIYATICTPGLSYLYHNELVDRAQAAIIELLGLYPIFALEEGKLVPMEKLKSYRHAVGFFQEFLDEFDHLKHIAFIQGSIPTSLELRLLRETSGHGNVKVPFTKHTLNLPLSVLFGPNSLGLIALENR